MRRPWPSPFGRARHAHRYHRRAKRKYRAVAINGFTPEHLRRVGRPRERERERERGRREETSFLPASSAPRLARQDSGEHDEHRPTLKNYRSLHLSMRSRSFVRAAGSRCASRIDPGLPDPDPRSGSRSNGRAASRGVRSFPEGCDRVRGCLSRTLVEILAKRRGELLRE